MRLDDLWAYVTGYVRIRVTGPALERFINLAASRGHRLWATRRSDRTLVCNVTVGSFRRLRAAAHRTRSRVKILERHGLPFLLHRASRRPLLLAGAVLSLIALYFLSGTIWFVRVEGAKELAPDLIREVAASVGLAPGTVKWAIDPDEIERELMLAVNGLSWAAVEVHGVVALIRVVEKDPLEKPEVPLPPADVVAAKDGVIVTLIVLSGEAVAREGDTVRKGDLLIRGTKTLGPPPPAEPGQPAPPPKVDAVARGVVKARVWYQAYAEASLHTLSHEPTGRVWRRTTLQLGDAATLPVTGWWSQPQGLYERRTVRRVVPFWRIGGRNVEIVTTVFEQVSDVRRDLSPAEAEALAREAAFAALASRLPEGAEPISRGFEVTVKNDIVVGVLATAEVVEDIAQTKERR